MAETSISSQVRLIPDTRLIEDAFKRLENRGLKLNLNSRNFSQPLGRITGNVQDFERSLDAANSRVIAFGASASILFGVTRGFKALLDSTVQVEKSLKEVNVILNASNNNLKNYGDQLFKIARETGQNFTTASKALLEFARQGLSAETSLKRTRDALVLTRLTNLDVTDSIQSITSALNSFDKSIIDSTNLVNKFASVDAQFSVSAGDLANSLSRVGSTAQDAGVGLDQLLAIVTSVKQKTQRDGAVIGNSLKTIFTRIQRTDVLDQLEGLGIASRDLRGNTLPAIQVLQNLATEFDKLGDSQRAQVSELVGGIYQINVLRAALGDLNKQYSVYNQALLVSENATDAATRRSEELNKTLSAMANSTLQNLIRVGAKVGENIFGPAAKTLLGGTDFLLGDGRDAEQQGAGYGEKIGDGITKGIGQFLAGPGALAIIAVLGKIVNKFTTQAVGDIKTLLNLNKVKEQQLVLEKSVNNILSLQPNIIDQVIKKNLTLLDLQKMLTQEYQKQTSFVQQKGAITSIVSSNMLKEKRVTVDTKTGDVRATPRGFSGLIPNFAAGDSDSIIETIGAYQGGYKPGKIKKMHISGIGKVTYNDAEEIRNIPGFSQPAIIPPKHSKAGKAYKEKFENQLGFNPYKAEGMIPNYANLLGYHATFQNFGNKISSQRSFGEGQGKGFYAFKNINQAEEHLNFIRQSELGTLKNPKIIAGKFNENFVVPDYEQHTLDGLDFLRKNRELLNNLKPIKLGNREGDLAQTLKQVLADDDGLSFVSEFKEIKNKKRLNYGTYGDIGTGFLLGPLFDSLRESHPEKIRDFELNLIKNNPKAAFRYTGPDTKAYQRKFSSGFTPNFSNIKPYTSKEIEPNIFKIISDFGGGFLHTERGSKTARLGGLRTLPSGQGTAKFVYEDIFDFLKEKNFKAIIGDLLYQNTPAREDTPVSKIKAALPQLIRGRFGSSNILGIGNREFRLGGGQKFDEDLLRQAGNIYSSVKQGGDVGYTTYLNKGSVPNYANLDIYRGLSLSKNSPLANLDTQSLKFALQKPQNKLTSQDFFKKRALDTPDGLLNYLLQSRISGSVNGVSPFSTDKNKALDFAQQIRGDRLRVLISKTINPNEIIKTDKQLEERLKNSNSYLGLFEDTNRFGGRINPIISPGLIAKYAKNKGSRFEYQDFIDFNKQEKELALIGNDFSGNVEFLNKGNIPNYSPQISRAQAAQLLKSKQFQSISYQKQNGELGVYNSSQYRVRRDKLVGAPAPGGFDNWTQFDEATSSLVLHSLKSGEDEAKFRRFNLSGIKQIRAQGQNFDVLNRGLVPNYAGFIGPTKRLLKALQKAGIPTNRTSAGSEFNFPFNIKIQKGNKEALPIFDLFHETGHYQAIGSGLDKPMKRPQGQRGLALAERLANTTALDLMSKFGLDNDLIEKFKSYAQKNYNTYRKSSSGKFIKNIPSSPFSLGDLEFLSKGLIPNFNQFLGYGGLNQSIQREKNAGIPSSQIRVGQSPKLKSSSNPLGLGVYNTKDEPLGLNQGIQRYANMGLNPKKAGMKNYNEGLVPNYATNPLEFEFGVPEKLRKQAEDAYKLLADKVKSGALSFDKLRLAAESFVKIQKVSFEPLLKNLQSIQESRINPIQTRFGAANSRFPNVPPNPFDAIIGSSFVTPETIKRKQKVQQIIEDNRLRQEEERKTRRAFAGERNITSLTGPRDSSFEQQRISEQARQFRFTEINGRLYNTRNIVIEKPKNINDKSKKVINVSDYGIVDSNLLGIQQSTPRQQKRSLERQLEIQRIKAKKQQSDIESKRLEEQIKIDNANTRELQGLGDRASKGKLFGFRRDKNAELELERRAKTGDINAENLSNVSKGNRADRLQNRLFQGSFAIPLLTSTLGEFVGDKTKNRRIGQTALSGLGDIGSFALAGAAISGPAAPVGAAVGATIGAGFAGYKIFKAFNDDLPEFAKASELANESLSRTTDSLQKFVVNLETLKEVSKGNIKITPRQLLDLEREQSSLLFKFNPDQQKRLNTALSSGKPEDLNEAVGFIAKQGQLSKNLADFGTDINAFQQKGLTGTSEDTKRTESIVQSFLNLGKDKSTGSLFLENPQFQRLFQSQIAGGNFNDILKNTGLDDQQVKDFNNALEKSPKVAKLFTDGLIKALNDVPELIETAKKQKEYQKLSVENAERLSSAIRKINFATIDVDNAIKFGGERQQIGLGGRNQRFSTLGEGFLSLNSETLGDRSLIDIKNVISQQQLKNNQQEQLLGLRTTTAQEINKIGAEFPAISDAAKLTSTDSELFKVLSGISKDFRETSLKFFETGDLSEISNLRDRTNLTLTSTKESGGQLGTQNILGIVTTALKSLDVTNLNLLNGISNSNFLLEEQSKHLELQSNLQKQLLEQNKRINFAGGIGNTASPLDLFRRFDRARNTTDFGKAFNSPDLQIEGLLEQSKIFDSLGISGVFRDDLISNLSKNIDKINARFGLGLDQQQINKIASTQIDKEVRPENLISDKLKEFNELVKGLKDSNTGLVTGIGNLQGSIANVQFAGVGESLSKFVNLGDGEGIKVRIQNFGDFDVEAKLKEAAKNSRPIENSKTPIKEKPLIISDNGLFPKDFNFNKGGNVPYTKELDLTEGFKGIFSFEERQKFLENQEKSKISKKQLDFLDKTQTRYQIKDGNINIRGNPSKELIENVGDSIRRYRLENEINKGIDSQNFRSDPLALEDALNPSNYKLLPSSSAFTSNLGPSLEFVNEEKSKAVRAAFNEQKKQQLEEKNRNEKPTLLKASADAFSKGLQYSREEFEKDFIETARSISDSLKNGFKSAFSEFANGTLSAEGALKKLGLSFAENLFNKSLDIGTNLLFSGVDSLFSKKSDTSGGTGGQAVSAFADILKSFFSKNAEGGYIKKYARGGTVTGGSGIKDDVPALLQNGEYVIRKSAVNKYGENFLNGLNAGGYIKKYAGGGEANVLLDNRFEVDKLKPTSKSQGRRITDSNLSILALTDESNPQNEKRIRTEQGFYDYLYNRKEALSQYERAKKQRLQAAYINVLTSVAGSYLGSYGNSNQFSSGLKETKLSGSAGYAQDSYGLTRANGGYIKKYANGGLNPNDTVPALLMGGEVVMNRDAVNKYGVEFFNRINSSQAPVSRLGYANGGVVGSPNINTYGSSSMGTNNQDKMAEAIFKLIDTLQANTDSYDKNNKGDSIRNRNNRADGQNTNNENNSSPTFYINTNVTIASDGSAKSDTQTSQKGETTSDKREQAKQLSERIKSTVYEVIIKEKNQGGLLQKAR